MTSSTLKFKVFSGTKIVGFSRLEKGDPPMGVAFGEMVPTDSYDSIREECIHNHKDQTHLELSVQSESGEAIPCMGVAVLEYSPDSTTKPDPGCIELNVLGIRSDVYSTLFPEHVAAYEKLFPPAP